MANHSIQPRILFVTPDVIFIPDGSGNHFDYKAKTSLEFADFPGDIVFDLMELGADIHITQPDYRKAFADIQKSRSNIPTRKMPESRVHLTADRSFFYAKFPLLNHAWENMKVSLAFQREVFNYVIPLVQPDLIHCHNWMTGLIPAMAKISGIPCIFTVQNFDNGKNQLSVIEDVGIDGAAFWQHLFFERLPANYEETRETNPIDFLLSGIFAAQFVDVAEPTFAGGLNRDLSSYRELLNQILIEKSKYGSVDVNRITSVGAKQYINLYERMLHQPLIEIKGDSYEVQADFTDKHETVIKGYKRGQEISGNFGLQVVPV